MLVNVGNTNFFYVKHGKYFSECVKGGQFLNCSLSEILDRLDFAF